MSQAGEVGGRDQYKGKPSDRKQGYIEIRPMTSEGPGLRITGFDRDTKQPVDGCVETAMNEEDGLLSAMLDVNECMKEHGYDIVRQYTQYVDFVEGLEDIRPGDVIQHSGETEMPKSVTQMTDTEFNNYIANQREQLARYTSILDSAPSTPDTTDAPGASDNSDASDASEAADMGDASEPSEAVDMTDATDALDLGDTSSSDNASA